MFTSRIKTFHLLGIPIYLDLSWFLVFALITWSLAGNVFPQMLPEADTSMYWLMGVAGALGLFASILAHELGHCVMAQRFDLPIRGITLFIFGGVAEMSAEPRSARAEFLVAIAGPVVSVAIALGCYIGGELVNVGTLAPIQAVLYYLASINALVVGFNLIPAFPLDGGRVLRSILWHFSGNLKWSTWISSALGAGFGLLLMVLGVLSFLAGNLIGGIWLLLIGMFVRHAAQMAYQQVLMRRALEGEPVQRFMCSDVVTVPPEITMAQLVEDYIYRYHHKLYPVTQAERLLGCILVNEVRDLPRTEWSRHTVSELLIPCSQDNTIHAQADAMQALAKMNREEASRLLVVDGDRLQGILSLKDLLKFMSLKIELEESK